MAKKHFREEESAEEKPKNDQHKLLRDRAKKVLFELMRKKLILDFRFTGKNGELDVVGIDLVVCFSPNGDGKRGALCCQEKTRQADMKEHMKRYPCVPVYLLNVGDSEMEIEYTFILLFLKCNIYNHKPEVGQELLARKRFLEKDVGKQEHRVAVSFK